MSSLKPPFPLLYFLSPSLSLLSMDLRRITLSLLIQPNLSSGKPSSSLFLSFTRRCLTYATSPVQQCSPHHQQQPLDQDQCFRKKIISVLSKPSLNHSQCKEALIDLTPHSFDRVFFHIQSSVNPRTTLNFFSFASESLRFSFTVRSYCLLIRLLIGSKIDIPARLLLIRLIDGKVPALFENQNDRHLEIASKVTDFDVKEAVSVAVFDLLVHVYCTQFKVSGLKPAFDVFCFLTSRGLFPSPKTCHYLLNSLVKENEFERSYEVFAIMSHVGVSLDVYSFSTAINAFCKGGKVEEATQLFVRMEDLGFTPNVVTYNTLIHGYFKSGNLDEAFRLKERMINNGAIPTLVTYSIFINGLVKLEKFDDAHCVLKEMLDKGIAPNEVIYNTLIDGYCNAGKLGDASTIRDVMVSKGVNPNSVTYSSLVKGFCMVGQMEEAEYLLEKMLSMRGSINPGSFSTIMNSLCKKKTV